MQLDDARAARDGVAVVAATCSDTGPRREHNEDAVLALLPADEAGGLHLVAVADGLGGHAAGEVASRLVVDTIAAHAPQWASERPERWLRRVFTAANLALHDYALANPDAFNLQSTATALTLHGNEAVIGHVGDCRAYRIRDGDIELMTTDHTRATEMLRLRLITPEQAVDHPARNQLTRSLGAELMMSVDVVRCDVAPGDTWVVCSDGLWSEVARPEIAAAVTSLEPAAAAQHLVGTACDRDAPDNVSVAILRIDALAPALERPRRWFGRR
ncbi:MAG: PP2C family protein-serine/threonine phosphatase [Candidatus Dormibacteria bacterium]